MATKKRLIDANALVDAIEDIDWYHVNAKGKLVDGANPANNTPIYKAFDIYNAIKDAPTVDAVEVVHGRWIAVPSSDMMTGKAYKCSECNKMRYGSFMPNYCQNCGAKMDLKGE